MADQETPATGDTPTTDTSAEAPSPDQAGGETAAPPPAKKTAAKKAAAKKTTTRKTAAKKTTAKKAAPAAEGAGSPAPDTAGADSAGADPAASDEAAKPAKKTPAKKSAAKRTTKKAAAAPAEAASASADAGAGDEGRARQAPGTVPLFQPPEQVSPPPRKRAAKKAAPAEQTDTSGDAATDEAPEDKPRSGNRSGAKGGTRSGATSGGRAGQEQRSDAEQSADQADADATDSQDDSGEEGGEGSGRRRRRRGGRRRRKSGGDSDGGDEQSGDSGDNGDPADAESGDGEGSSEGASSRRRRKRRREGDGSGTSGDDPEQTVTRVRKPRSAEDEITAVSGSTRLEAKKQRRREGREAGRRRAPIVSEAEFLARRESVDRVMVIRQRDDLTQIGVLEDKVLVEHYVARESQTSLIGNVYLGRVQNVLPSMEAAFIDIGKGRNAVLYAGEVNWSALGHKDGAPRKIESVLTSGQTVLVQVTKDPIGHKGARLTSQVSLAGRFLVYVPDGTTSGISRKLPDTERSRLKSLLKDIVPDTAGVIVRTAAEGASEEELTRDVERLKARWEDIESKVKGTAPKLLYGEPDLTLKVVRDLFTEDFTKLVIQGADAWDTVHGYVTHVAPDLADRLERYEAGDGRPDVFAAHRIDEQIAKALDRKVWLPSGGSLIIDRTEAMTVVDVNTGKFTGSGGNLEETVTKNNLEAAEEVVRQLRLRDIGGIIVVDFIDMVLESNRDLVLRRLVECLGRDRTRHQVAEVTSLGLVQMTRKRIGTGLLEAFSETCDHCQGRGLKLHDMPVEPKKGGDDDGRRGGRRRGGRGRNGSDDDNGSSQPAPTPKDVAAMARPERSDDGASAEGGEDRPADDRRVGRSTRSRSGAGRTDQETPEPSTNTAPGTQPDAEAADKPAPRKRSARRPAGPPAGVEPAAAEQSGNEQSGNEQASVTQPGAEQSAAEPAEVPQQPAPVVEKPQVVTRTRKRASGAAKPTAEPSTAADAERAAPEQPGDETTASEAPVAAPQQPAPAVEKPTVVTRTRRRAASRPAGPPSAGSDDDSAGPRTDAVDAPAPLEKIAEAGHVGEPADHGMVEPGVAAREPGPEGADPAEDEEQPVVEHVPIKKKGSRKR